MWERNEGGCVAWLGLHPVPGKEALCYRLYTSSHLIGLGWGAINMRIWNLQPRLTCKFLLKSTVPFNCMDVLNDCSQTRSSESINQRNLHLLLAFLRTWPVSNEIWLILNTLSTVLVLLVLAVHWSTPQCLQQLGTPTEISLEPHSPPLARTSTGQARLWHFSPRSETAFCCMQMARLIWVKFRINFSVAAFGGAAG